MDQTDKERTMTYSKSFIMDWLAGIATGAINLHIDNMAVAESAIEMLQDVEDEEDEMGSLEQISPHFTLSELCYSSTAEAQDIENVPNDAETDQLDQLANKTLEKIRAICNGKPVMISSGFRCQELNTCIGGATNSAHLYGAAADITIPQFGSPLDVCNKLFPHLRELEIDQLIYETNSSGGAWVHVGRATGGAAPRHQAFSIIKGVTQNSPFPA
jgi:uncharacterized protein YcbK (DUF882 family)